MTKRNNVWYVCRATDYLQGIYVECPSRSGAKIYADDKLPGKSHMLTELVPPEQLEWLTIHRAEFDVGPRAGKTHEMTEDQVVQLYGGEDK